MDPNANLAEQRRLIAAIQQRQDMNDRTQVDDQQDTYDMYRLAELVQALDEWLSGDGTPDGHGFLPRAWDPAYTQRQLERGEERS